MPPTSGIRWLAPWPEVHGPGPGPHTVVAGVATGRGHDHRRTGASSPLSAPQRRQASPSISFGQAAGPQRGSGGQPGPRRLWKARPDGRSVFRHPAPLVLWWAWVAFALINICYLIVDGLSIYSVRGIGALLVVTGVLYACALHARVEADDEGITIYNPLRDHRAPWGAVEAVTLGDSVEFACARQAPKKAKKICSWALYSSRRSRARRQMYRAMFPALGPRGISSRAPAEAAELAGQQPSQIMTAELGRRAAAARGRGSSGGVLHSTVAWLPVAAIAVPAVLLLIAFLVR